MSTFYSISGCVLCSISLSCIINGKLDLKDVVFSPIAGGVVVGSSAAFINNNVGSLLLGVGAAVLLVALLQLDTKIRWAVVVENYVLYLYAIIGACGGLASAIFADQSSSNSSFSNMPQGYALQTPTNQLTGVGISAGIGIGGGVLLGLLLCLISA